MNTADLIRKLRSLQQEVRTDADRAILLEACDRLAGLQKKARDQHLELMREQRAMRKLRQDLEVARARRGLR